MREIKFRAFSKSLNIIFPSMDFVQLIENDGFGYDYDDFEIMQYTGLKDKNGVEIYEGDVVKEHFGAYGKVSFLNGAFVLELLEEIHRPIAHYVCSDFGNKTEVIGNMYENPELL